MIRGVTIVSLVALLVLVVYLPSAHPPDRFVSVVRSEQAAIEKLWGTANSLRILSREVAMVDTAKLVFGAAAPVDGLIVRKVKAQEFRQHDPEWFAVYASLAIMTICGTVIGFVVPVGVHPMVLPWGSLLVALLISRSVGNFHARN